MTERSFVIRESTKCRRPDGVTAFRRNIVYGDGQGTVSSVVAVTRGDEGRIE